MGWVYATLEPSLGLAGVLLNLSHTLNASPICAYSCSQARHCQGVDGGAGADQGGEHGAQLFLPDLVAFAGLFGLIWFAAVTVMHLHASTM